MPGEQVAIWADPGQERAVWRDAGGDGGAQTLVQRPVPESGPPRATGRQPQDAGANTVQQKYTLRGLAGW